MKHAIVLLVSYLVVAGAGYSADVATQLRSPNDLSRSPVVRWNRYQLQNQQDSLEQNLPTINKSFFKSLLIPGWGQFSQHKYIRTGVFLGVEAAVLAGYFAYNNKYNDQIDVSHNFAKEHWSVDRWLDPLGYNPEEDPSTHKIEIRCPSTDEVYEVPQHTVDNQPFIPDEVSTCTDREVVWNGESYENVYKYDEFAMGWDTWYRWDSSVDTPDNTTPEPGEEGYFINPNRLKNKKQREKANEYAEIATFFIYGLIGNHVVSAFEALLFDGPQKQSSTAPNFSMRYSPRRINKNLYSSVNFQVEW